MAFLHLHTITVFSSFPIILGDILQKTATAGTVHHLVTDGGQFVKRIVHGEKRFDNPGYLLFTAPYKLCEGDCEDLGDNFAMAFPIYVGKKGKEKYQEMYGRDFEKVHLAKPNAPFKQRPTKKLFTPCPSKVTTEPTTTTTEETETMIPTTKATERESTMTKTTTEFFEIETLTPILHLATESIIMPETETTVFKIPKVTETSNTPKVDITVALAETTSEQITISAAEVTNIVEATLANTAINQETTTTFQTETPTFSDTVVTETEDITFETEPDTTDPMKDVPETTFVTNINGVRCPLRICNKKTKVTAKIINLICSLLLLTALQPGLANMRWSRWSATQEPNVYNFRRNQHMPVKTPGHQCQCPPSKECVVDFKINEDAIEFLNIRGVLKKESVQQLQEDIEKLEPIHKIQRSRRNNDEIFDEEECCCPPRNVMMPTFITDKKFNETLARLNIGETIS